LANGEDALRNLEDALRQIAQNAKTELIRSDDDPKGKRVRRAGAGLLRPAHASNVWLADCRTSTTLLTSWRRSS
jgi:hypothetical protein